MSGRPDLRLAERGGWIECLRAPAMLFGAIARARGFLYSRGVLPSYDVGPPVVSVGNLVAGGTGKTPMIVWLARELAKGGRVVGLVSRGYQGSGADLDGGADSTSGDGARNGNDEARMLADMLPGVLHLQDRDRVDAARRLADAGIDVILMDDGFQHRRLSRELDLVLVDALRPFGLPRPTEGGEPVEAFLPRGLMREPLSALRRAHAAVLTRTDAVDAGVVDGLEARIRAAAPGLPIARSEHRPTALRVERCGDDGPGSETLELEALRGREVDLFSGIGNPGAFEGTIRSLGGRIHEHRAFGDHHGFQPGDLTGLGVDRPVITTAKDAARLRLQSTVAAPDPLWVLDVELEITQGAEALRALLAGLPESDAARARQSIHEGLHG